ncbi:MAG TPA: AraC family transcriptional regulator [Jatrophihabitantaceae bacterium]|jgi:AraC-like DNA-binding protein
MPGTVGGIEAGALERSCRPGRDTIRVGAGAEGLQRVEAYFSARGFEPHRHDTYGIGITTQGVQTFRYRGERRVCRPGQLHVLHPDELHDGAAATSEGFRYRIAYVAPDLIRGAFDDRALPFVQDPIQDQTPASRRVVALLNDIDQPLSDVARAEAAADLADLLAHLSGRHTRLPILIDRRAVAAVRDYLDAHAGVPTPLRTLEQVAGLDRFTLARQFRRAYGTSPDRYRTLRRLDLVRAAIQAGTPLARAAADAGFADQSHLTRQFKRAYGLTPARWVSALRSAA